MRGVLAAMKVRGMSIYGSAHERRCAGGGDPLAKHAMPTSVDEIGRRHRGVGGARGGNLRAAVFGANDGLVSNASLILGVAGATADRHLIGVSGLAGLLAGAFSMAAGEYVSMRSQREMFERQISAERDELQRYPAEEAAELALIYEARGLAERTGDARRREHHRQSGERARHAGARGAGPGSRASSARRGARRCSRFFRSRAARWFRSCRSRWAAARARCRSRSGSPGAALFAMGATISLFTGRGALPGGVRMLLIGAGAGAITNLIGRLLGVK